ncbi:hypothetical protein [Cryobacterium sp. MDB2-33-2]|uniref:hypothetical protein n=1 Tax=Cryobacterium sp. MDB2-33-2 TaxID=1259179 RepID=UPI00106BAA8A|nr:hypothetical protein [Cryobacterium sp. MDB2-33-2]TFC06549.1 hypothetical protein E3O59_10260 [Cryobacterium sp. MDB2-33-2]
MFTFMLTERRLDGSYETVRYTFSTISAFQTFWRPEFARIDSIIEDPEPAPADPVSPRRRYRDPDIALHSLRMAASVVVAALASRVMAEVEAVDMAARLDQHIPEIVNIRRQVNEAAVAGMEACDQLAVRLRRRLDELDGPGLD